MTMETPMTQFALVSAHHHELAISTSQDLFWSHHDLWVSSPFTVGDPGTLGPGGFLRQLVNIQLSQKSHRFSHASPMILPWITLGLLHNSPKISYINQAKHKTAADRGLDPHGSSWH